MHANPPCGFNSVAWRGFRVRQARARRDLLAAIPGSRSGLDREGRLLSVKRSFAGQALSA
jgi:hypothetical protein